MSLTVSDLDNIYLEAKAKFDEMVAEYNKTFFEPVMLMAFAQQIRQLPQPVQDQLKQQAPDAWERIFGAGGTHDSTV